MAKRTAILKSVIESDHVGLSVDKSNVLVSGSYISGNQLGIHVVGGSNQFYIGNVIRGGVQLGGPVPKPSMEQLIGAIQKISNATERADLLASLERVLGEPSQSKRQSAYNDFVASLANHMTLIAPFLPALMAAL